MATKKKRKSPKRSSKKSSSDGLLYFSAYARHRKVKGLDGGTLRAVQVAIDTGRISPNSKGKIDPKTADRDWEANTDASKRHNGKTLATLSYQESRRINFPEY